VCSLESYPAKVALRHGRASDTKKLIDGPLLLFYYRLNTGKEVI
jgi:hypothetical protein